MNTRTLKGAKGITLVALIITIIVLLILAMVSIRLVMNGGIIDKAKWGTQSYKESEIQEQIKLAYTEWQTARWTGENNAVEFITERLQNTFGENSVSSLTLTNKKLSVEICGKKYEYDIDTGVVVEKTYVAIEKSTEKNKSYVGYFADIEGDGIVDGIIFVDLLTGSIRDTQQVDTITYTLPTNVNVNNVKSYYISNESYTYQDYTNPVVTPKGEGEDRFYILTLKNDECDTVQWYGSALINNYENVTSNDFGTGKTNTQTMITKWNNKEFGETEGNLYNNDLWGKINSRVENGWFVPSVGEMAALLNELGITFADYEKVNSLSDFLRFNEVWTSSIWDEEDAWTIYGNTISQHEFWHSFFVRLARTM